MEAIVAIVIFGLIALYVSTRVGGGSRAAAPVQAQPDRPPVAQVSIDQLVQHLRSGESLDEFPVPFPMKPNERCVGIVDARVSQWLPGDGSYTSKHVGYVRGTAGGLALGGALGAVNAVGNAGRRARAQQNAAERWRSIGDFRIYVTTDRLALDGGRVWHDVWFTSLRTLELDKDAVVIQTNGDPSSRFEMSPSNYWFVMLRYLSFGDIVDH